MSNDDILVLAKKHGLDIGMRPPARLVPISEDILAFRRPDGLTLYGENLMSFSAALVAAERARFVAALTERADWWDSIAKAHEGGKRKHQANRCCLRALELREAARVLAKGVAS